MRTTNTRTAAALAAAAAASAAVVAAAPAAHAETTTITDRVGDTGRYGDIRTVTTTLTGRHATVVTTFAKRGRFPDETIVYLDTSARSDGPEHVAILDTDAFGDDQTRYQVFEASGFHTVGEAVCTPRNGEVETEGADSVTMPIPTRCLLDADRVQVSVETNQYVGGRNDHAPRRHHFGEVTHAG